MRLEEEVEKEVKKEVVEEVKEEVDKVRTYKILTSGLSQPIISP